jgi:serine/threonine protein kinase
MQTREVLGSGAFGCVYKGLMSTGLTSDQEEVAVKTTENDNEDRIKFLQEAAIMGQFHHPNIISILGVVIQNPVSVHDSAHGNRHGHYLTISSTSVQPISH